MEISVGIAPGMIFKVDLEEVSVGIGDSIQSRIPANEEQ